MYLVPQRHELSTVFETPTTIEGKINGSKVAFYTNDR
jgi:hypothetical protein